jgi:multiple sugar transport system substrate-binding protein
MPTIKDIAKAAGVSHGTASNVLNGRGNVSVEKIKLVEKAALELGYKINTKAQTLRQGKTRGVAVIVPSIVFPHYADLYEVLQKELTSRDYSVQLYTTNSMEVSEAASIEDALSARVSAIISASCFTDAPSVYSEHACDVPVVFVDGKPVGVEQNAMPQIDSAISSGFDYAAAGRELASFLLNRNAKKIATFTGSEHAYHIDQFLQGFLPLLEAEGIDCKLVTSYDYLASVQAFELFEPDCVYDYIVCSDMLRQQAAIAAHSFSSVHPLPSFVTITSRAALSDSNAYLYELDYKRLAYRIALRLITLLEEDARDFSPIFLENSGIKYLSPRSKTLPKTLNFLTVASPSSVALERLLPHFRRKTGIDMKLTVLGLNELYDKIKEEGNASDYDLIRMDMAWISELAPKVYAPLDTIPYDWDRLFDQMLPVFLEDYTSLDSRRICLPYDPSTQILFYRADLFNDPTIKRMYYEYCKEELSVPETFAQYNKISKFFTRSCHHGSPLKFGNTVAIGNSGVSPSEYLPRLFAEGGSLFDQDGRISLNTAAALRALESYKEAYEYSDKRIYQWWKNALEGFAEGNAAMTMVFMNHASDIINTKISNIAGKIGFDAVPGGKPLVGGGVIGIHPHSKAKEAACEFISWLYSDEVVSVFTMLGGLSPCKTVYNNRNVLELYPWLSAAKRSFSIGQRRVDNKYYKNFSEKMLEQIISVSIKDAVTGQLSAQEALSLAQNRCEEFFIQRNSAEIRF